MGHAITPSASARAPLTRTSDVLLVLQNGGSVRAVPGDRDLLELFDRDGREVPAWQTAIKNAKARREQQP